MQERSKGHPEQNRLARLEAGGHRENEGDEGDDCNAFKERKPDKADAESEGVPK